MKSQLNGKNKIKAANTWAVSLMRYEQEELTRIRRNFRR